MFDPDELFDRVAVLAWVKDQRPDLIFDISQALDLSGPSGPQALIAIGFAAGVRKGKEISKERIREKARQFATSAAGQRAQGFFDEEAFLSAKAKALRDVEDTFISHG